MNGELKKRPVPQSASSDGNVDTDDLSEVTGKPAALQTNGAVWVVFFSLLIDLLAFTVILPLFPSLLEFYASNKEVSTGFII